MKNSFRTKTAKTPSRSRAVSFRCTVAAVLICLISALCPPAVQARDNSLRVASPQLIDRDRNYSRAAEHLKVKKTSYSYKAGSLKKRSSSFTICVSGAKGRVTCRSGSKYLKVSGWKGSASAGPTAELSSGPVLRRVLPQGLLV